MNFIDIKEQKPYKNQIVLVETNEEWIPYCICKYITGNQNYFEELSEGRLYWFESEIIRWASIEDIKKPNVVHCKDCVKRYNDILCPLAQMNETYNEDDGHDYFYTYGESENDDFYCAEGEINGKQCKVSSYDDAGTARYCKASM